MAFAPRFRVLAFGIRSPLGDRDARRRSRGPRRRRPRCARLSEAGSRRGRHDGSGPRLGITPSQHSSGGKDKLGGITKRGNRYLRKMLVVGCTSVLRVAHKYKGALAEWIVAMRARKPERVVAVGLANKLARIAWAMMSTGEAFRTELYTKA